MRIYIITEYSNYDERDVILKAFYDANSVTEYLKDKPLNGIRIQEITVE